MHLFCPLHIFNYLYIRHCLCIFSVLYISLIIYTFDIVYASFLSLYISLIIYTFGPVGSFLPLLRLFWEIKFSIFVQKKSSIGGRVDMRGIIEQEIVVRNGFGNSCVRCIVKKLETNDGIIHLQFAKIRWGVQTFVISFVTS